MTDALDDVVDTALERALVDGTDARRYFALAGALERARTTAGATGDRDDTPRRGGVDGPHSAESNVLGQRDDYPESVSLDRFGAALVSTVAVRALEATRNDGIDADAWLPGGDAQTDLVATGARLALRRCGTDPETVAARSGLPRYRLGGRFTVAGDRRSRSDSSNRGHGESE
ncbi:MAG: hypothetical protein ABEI27_10260 [Halobellus sp.]|uniref:hypothetical protein n=1 Tax=Halobellus sp. TaxID=1979212 RepID=UPI0035D49FD5